jgi:hypothetical protein
MMISSDVCRVPLEDTQNATAVAAVFGGAYHETTCGFFEKCSALHVQYSNGKDGASIATWFSCEVDTVRIGVAMAAFVAAAIIVFVLLRRFRGRSNEGTEMMPNPQRLKRG